MTTINRQPIESNPNDTFASAVLFLSVGAAPQLNTSSLIEIQRQLGHHKAAELNTKVVQEFVEVGVSARNASKRPGLQAMFAYCEEHPDIRYAVFPGLHRVSRNHLDFLSTKQQFEELGVEIVSSKGDFIGSSDIDIRHQMLMLFSDASHANGRSAV